MSAILAKPATANWCLVLAACAWSVLIAVNGMLLVGGERYIGNPLYTLCIALAITFNLLGVLLRCYGAVLAHIDATTEPRKRYILTADDVTGEIHRPPVYRATATVVRSIVEPTADVVRPALPADVLPAIYRTNALRVLGDPLSDH